MAETSKLPEEDKANIRPRLRQSESLNTNTAGSNSWGTTSSTRASDGGATSSTGGFYNPGGDKTESPAGLRDAEEAADDTVGSGYSDESSNTTRRRVRFKVTRRRAIGGGIAGLIVTGAIFGSSSILQGPFEFIHIAQLLERFHFSSQQDASDNRLMMIARYIHDPSKPQNTRLGIVGNAIANKLETKIHDATGLSPKYNSTTGQFEGYVVDPEHENFKGKTNQQIIDELTSKYNLDPSAITLDQKINGRPDIIFNPDPGGINTLKRYRSLTSTSKRLLGEAGLSGVAAYTGTRILGTRANWTFHPIKQLDSVVQAKAIEAGRNAIDKLKEQFKSNVVEEVTTGVTPEQINATSNKDSKGGTGPGADNVANDANGLSQDTQQAAQDLKTGQDGVSNLSDKLSAKALAGGAAGVAGLLCVAKGVSDRIDQAKYDKAILPMMREAGQVISLGSQVQSGQDISTLQLGFYKDFLDQTDSKGNVTSTWNQARSIQAELGEPQTGPDIPKSGQVFGGNPLSFLNFGILNGICDALGSPLGIVVGVITGPISSLVSPVIVSQVSEIAAGWLSGAPVNPLAAGADFGNYVNYGARLSANDQFASAGGAQLSSSDSLAIKDVGDSLDKQNFQSHSLAYRLFNPNDDRTLVSQLIDKTGGSGTVQTLASMVHGFGNIFSSVIKLPASLFSGISSAASQPYDYHGLKAVGFTTSELGDSTYSDPFKNACYVVGCPDSGITGILQDPNKAQTYIDRAQKCFGIDISTDGTIESKTAAVNMYDSSYPGSQCQDSSNTDWMHIRFWLLDTATIEGYDCNQSDSPTSDQSCSDLGFDTTGDTSTASTASGGSLPSGSAQDLAKQLLPYIQKGQISCNGGEGTDCSDIQGTAKGTSIKHGSCNVDALDSRLVGLLLYLVQQGHTFVLSAICSDHPTNPTSLHHIGKAADFNIIDGVFMGDGEDANGTVPWTPKKLNAARNLDRDATSVLPKTAGFGQQQCGAGSFPFLSGFKLFPDACHHQHIEVGT